MADEKRPTVLTVLAVLALIGAVFSLIGGVILLIAAFPLMALSVVAGLLSLITAIGLLAGGVVGLLAGIKIFGDKPKGVYFMRLYAYIGLGFAILGQIATVIQLGSAGFTFSGLIRAIIFPAIVLVIIFTQQAVKDYEARVG